MASLAPQQCRTLVPPVVGDRLWYAFIALAIGATWDLYLHNLSLGDTGGDGSWDRIFPAHVRPVSCDRHCAMR